MSPSVLDRIREIALAMPEVTERRSHGEPCFFVRRRPICYFHNDHNGDGRISLWCPAPPGAQAELLSADSQRFFRPSASAAGVFADWVGVFLDSPRLRADDWHEVAEILEDAYRWVAPKSLSALLDDRDAR